MIHETELRALLDRAEYAEGPITVDLHIHGTCVLAYVEPTKHTYLYLVLGEADGTLPSGAANVLFASGDDEKVIQFLREKLC